MINFQEIPFKKEDLDELEKLNINFVFQPIIDAKNMELVAYEVLMRPLGKSPLQLIDEYRKMDKLRIIEIATTFGAAMEYKNRRYTTDMCINSFPSEALDDELSELYYHCFPNMAGKIIVEIVEYTDLDVCNWKNKRFDIEIHNMRVSIDDYSTGYNDMKAVEFFSPDYVKLDRSMVSEIQKDLPRQKKIKELIEEFHRRGIKVVAEGIETIEELDFFRNCTSVDLLQGFYLGMPE